jgi:hypothetical protein
MAKKDNGIPTADIKSFLATIPKFAPVYDAKDFCNRPFTLTKIDWTVFTPTERNGYTNSEKLKMTCITHSDGKEFILETSQKGITTIIGAIEAEGQFPCDIMIIQEGKFCTVVAAP